jgi:hypothetical protein
MNFELLQSLVEEASRETDQGVYTHPDAVLYLLASKEVSLNDVSEMTGIPLCTIVNLPTRSIRISTEEAEAIAEALDIGPSEFCMNEPLADDLDSTVSYGLMDMMMRRISARVESSDQPLRRWG